MASRSPRDDGHRSPGAPPPRRRAPHPGHGNYPADPPGGRGRRYDAASGAYLPPRTHNPHLPPLGDAPTHEFGDDAATASHTRAAPSGRAGAAYVPPEKVTVLRVMARRTRYFGARGVDMVYRAATADGADRSGLTALTMPVIVNYAVDAAMAVALANTLFFAAATGESKVNVGLYLALTIAPFAVIAPLIGPILDKLQHGRRIAMATTFALRTVLALLIIVNSSWDPVSGQLQYKPWILYPCALGLMVLSKSFGVLKSAVAPRVLPPSIDLVRVNSRLTMFGLVFGTIVAGGIAAALEFLLGKLMPFHIPGAMVFLAVLGVAGAYFCMKIPSWVEVTEGEVPTTLTYHGEPQADPAARATGARGLPSRLAASMRQPLGRTVVTGLWGNGTIRILTGFLTLYVAFYAKAQNHSGGGWAQLAMLGAVGAAAGVGNGLGNGLGTRLKLSNPPRIIVLSTAAATVATVLAAVFGTLAMVIVAGFVGSAVSAIAKVCLDSTIQDDLPEASRASAFGRSETVLQLCWVIGAALGVVLPTTLWIGFTVVSVLMGAGLVQTVVTSRGGTLIPGFGGRRPDEPAPTAPLRTPERRTHDSPSQRPTAAQRSVPPTRPQPRPRSPRASE
ncbi:MFS transporter [Gordonia sp. (in: high G+C Gram-positive bacteria)]|uniref:MFS transporter n=1 Tax=unclassified Gordonia (in: high G+C Gram-positive bacteria) TaxID=2657482 RepID=UPI002624E0B3|nr:MFS transporter [Gordonia sp. (in: high G+C Gram-positive bacteria)]